MGSALISAGNVTGMTAHAVAQEIFAHAVVYYYGTTFATIAGVLAQVVLSNILASARVIDIADGGDHRAWAFSIIWDVMP